MARPAKRRPRNTGSVRQLDSGRWQARYRDADQRLKAAPKTFDTKLDAQLWLADYAEGVAALEPAARKTVMTFEDYANAWLAAGGQRAGLKPRTAELYRQQLDSALIPEFGGLRLDRITAARVRAWYGSLDPEKSTRRRQLYALLSSIMSTAVTDEQIEASPCRIVGAHKRDRKTVTNIASPAEVEMIADAIAPRYRAAVLLAFWCALRQGEILELRRSDLDLDGMVVHIERAVTRTSEGFVVGEPKSEAGTRVVAIPPHIKPALTRHLEKYVGASAGALLFPSAGDPTTHLAVSALYSVFYRARSKAGRDDLRWHDLRHSGLTLAAQTGATTADLMAMAGHTKPDTAQIYQHSTSTRASQIAAAMSEAAGENVVPLRSRRRTASGT